MSSEPEGSVERVSPLRKGFELGGLELRRLIAGDDFCALWLTAPLDEGFEETCVRAIPAYNLVKADAYERFCSELAFWQGLPGEAAVQLYEFGRSSGYYFALMHYMAEGGVGEQLRRDGYLRDHIADFALDFARTLRSLHAGSGVHGNIKPSNVFPVRNKGVLLSDFCMSLWADEQEGGCAALRPHVMHPYRAPEQMVDPHDFDMRSDVYSFGMVVKRCLTDADPGADGTLPDVPMASWPGRLGTVIERCLNRDRDRRPADGFELLEMLCDATGAVISVSMVEERERRATRYEPPSDEPDTEDTEMALADARALVGGGLLEEAMDVLEGLPAGVDEVAGLVDEIEARQTACEALVREAVCLAEMGRPEAAAETVQQAEQIWPRSRILMALKADLAGQTGPDAGLLEGKIPGPLGESLEADRFAAARSMLERIVRDGPLTPVHQRAVRQFKAGRVRKAFLDDVNTAKRLYVLGHRRQAAEHWLEAARWLAPGPERERLRRIAGAAAKGKLQLDVPEDPASEAEQAPAARPAQQKRPRTRKILILVALLVAAAIVVILISAAG